MKKTMLLTSLIAVAAMAVGTTGNVEYNFGGRTEFAKDTDKTVIKPELEEMKVSTDIKIKEIGVSFGGTFKIKDVVKNIIENKPISIFEDTEIFGKYELPEIKGFNSYVKATISPKSNDKYYGTASLELDGNYTIKGVKLEANSKTTFPIVPYSSNGLFESDDLGALITSTHKISAEAKDVYMLDEVKGNVSLTHAYDKINANAKAKDVLAKAIKNVAGEVEVKYNKIKDVKLEGKAHFVVNVADKKLEYKNLDETLSEKNEARYMHDYNLKATYTGVKDTEIEVNPFLAHISRLKVEDGRLDDVIYGLNAKVAYKGVKNLTLTGKTQLAGTTIVLAGLNEKWTYGHFVFGANAKYDFNLRDNFVISPELDGTVKFNVNHDKKVKDDLEFVVTPKVSSEYKPLDKLTLKGSVEVPIKFGGINKDKFYKSTSVKTSLNVKYTW